MLLSPGIKFTNLAFGIGVLFADEHAIPGKDLRNQIKKLENLAKIEIRQAPTRIDELILRILDPHVLPKLRQITSEAFASLGNWYLGAPARIDIMNVELGNLSRIYWVISDIARR